MRHHFFLNSLPVPRVGSKTKRLKMSATRPPNAPLLHSVAGTNKSQESLSVWSKPTIGIWAIFCDIPFMFNHRGDCVDPEKHFQRVLR